MQQVNNSILLQSLTPELLSELIKSVFKSELEDFKKEFNNQTAKEDLMTREQVIDFLQNQRAFMEKNVIVLKNMLPTRFFVFIFL